MNTGKILLLGSAILLATACRMDRPEPLPEGPLCGVRIEPGKEKIEELDRPLDETKTDAKDLYAVQVYKGAIKYAYGIFDNPDQMNIELEEGKTYRIEVTAVERATAAIATENGAYGAPFDLGGTGKGPGKVTNRFTKTMTTGMNCLNRGTASIPEGNTIEAYDRPPLSRYYGAVEGIRPEEGMRIAIPLKWVCFALTVQPQDFREGTLEIEMEGAPKLSITAGGTESVTKRIFSFAHPDATAGDWSEEGYQETVPTTIRWIRADGTEQLLRNAYPFLFTRKYEKILHIICSDEPGDGIQLDKEAAELWPESPEIIQTIN